MAWLIATWLEDDNYTKSPAPEGMHSPETTPPPACPTPSEAPTEDFSDTEARTSQLPTKEGLLESYDNPEDIKQLRDEILALIEGRREGDRAEALRDLLDDPDTSQEDYQDRIDTIDKQYVYDVSLLKGRVKEALEALGADSDSDSDDSDSDDSDNNSSDGVVDPASGGSADESAEDSNNESSDGAVDSASGGSANQLATQELSSRI